MFPAIRRAGIALGELRRCVEKRGDLTAEGGRFTTKGTDLFAFVMGWLEKEAVIPPLGSHSTHVSVKVENVHLLGFPGKVTWSQGDAGLRVQLPPEKPSG